MLELIIAGVLLVGLAALLVVLLVFAVYQSSKRRIGYIPLPQRAVESVIMALDIKPRDVLYDLGCGDGRILLAAHQTVDNIKCYGVEINPVVVILARLRSRHAPNIMVARGNIQTTDLTKADRVFMYLSHEQMAELEPKLEKELRRGSKLVSCDFPLPKRKPTHKLAIGNKQQLGQNLYIYEY